MPGRRGAPDRGAPADGAPDRRAPDEEPPTEQPPTEEPGRKVVVCKYVATPGDSERLSHIVIVSTNALPGWDGAAFPFAFADAHVNSLALRCAEEGEQAHDVPLTECPGDEAAQHDPGDREAGLRDR